MLRKLYYGNALKIVPGLPAGDFPPVADSATAIETRTDHGAMARHRRRRLHRIASGAEALVGKGETVRIADNFITGNRQNLAVLGDRAEARRSATSRMPRSLARAVAGMDYVLHQAAIPSVPRSVQRPADLESRQRRRDAAAPARGARRARSGGVVYAASSSAYGDTPTLPKREDMPTQPLSPYALQKLVGEQYMQLFTALYGLETVSIRYFNVFGPRQDPSSPYSGVIALFVTALLAGKPPTIIGDGEQTRDFTYIANVVDGVLRAATAPGASGRSHQRRHRPADLDQRAGEDTRRASSASRQRRCTSTRAPVTCAIRSRTSRRRKRSSATNLPWDWRKACGDTVEWYRSEHNDFR